MFDTQVIMQDNSLDIAPQEFVKGNIQLYVDVVLLFVRLCFRGIKKISDRIHLPQHFQIPPTTTATNTTTK